MSEIGSVNSYVPKPIDSTEKAIEELRAVSENILAASNLETLQEGILRADEVNKRITVYTSKQRNQTEIIVKTIEEKVHFFLFKEVSRLKKDPSETSDIKGRLKNYEKLAEEWSGSRKDFLLDEIKQLYDKI